MTKPDVEENIEILLGVVSRLLERVEELENFINKDIL